MQFQCLFTFVLRLHVVCSTNEIKSDRVDLKMCPTAAMINRTIGKLNRMLFVCVLLGFFLIKTLGCRLNKVCKKISAQVNCVSVLVLMDCGRTYYRSGNVSLWVGWLECKLELLLVRDPPQLCMLWSDSICPRCTRSRHQEEEGGVDDNCWWTNFRIFFSKCALIRGNS